MCRVMLAVYWETHRLLNATVAQIKNLPFLVSTTIELKTIRTTQQQQQTTKYSTLKVIPESYSEVSVVSAFFGHF